MKGSQEFKIILVKIFNDILDYQESALSATEFARELAITIGTLTISMNGLVRKGYVIKERSEKDKRVVLVSLSQKGEQAFLKYQEYYDDMVNSMLENLDDAEMDILMSALRKINIWVKKRLI